MKKLLCLLFAALLLCVSASALELPSGLDAVSYTHLTLPTN